MQRLFGIAVLVCLLSAQRAQSVSIAGVDFSDFIVIDLEAGADLSLSTAGDLYLQAAPSGLSASSLKLDAALTIHANVPVDVSGAASFCTLPVCADLPPTIFQDVVIRVLGVAGDLHFDSGGSIVIDAVPIPEPSTGTLVLIGLVAFAPLRRPA